MRPFFAISAAAFLTSLVSGTAAVAQLLSDQTPAVGTVTSVATDGAWVRFLFDPELLAGHGFELEPAATSIELVAAPPSSLVVDAADADFEGITNGLLHLVGGFTLRSGSASASLTGLDIRPGAQKLTIDFVDSRGRQLLHGDQMHFRYDPKTGRLRLENVDVRIAPALAAELRRPELAGLAIARLELEATTRAFRAPAPEGCSSCSLPVWDADMDVQLSDLGSVQQIARASGKVTINLNTQIKNVGTADVPWYRKFSCPVPSSCPPFNTDQHPYLVWAVYRIAPIAGAGTPTALEMLGQSALKHAFFATNQDCCCAGGQILWAAIGGATHDTIACSDVYGAGNNNDPNAIGPRDELDAHSGLWTSTGSFFDQNSDGICDYDTAGSPGGDCGSLTFTDTFDRRLVVVETDLSVPEATYYTDAWYVVRDDVDIFNSMGWKPTTPAFGGSSWTFAVTPASGAPNFGSVLDAWVPLAAPPEGSSHERIDTGVGHLSLAAKSTALEGGQFHYEYAVMNHDLDRKVQSFRVPLPEGVAVSNTVFRGVASGTGSAWTITREPDGILFQAPVDVNVNALDWGTLFSFGFDVDAAPGAGSVDLGALEQTPDLVFDSPAVTPGGALGHAVFFDDFESGGTARWSEPAP